MTRETNPHRGGRTSAVHRSLEIIAALPPLTWLTINVLAPLDRRLMRATEGRLSLTGSSTILLVTRGARSGETRWSTLPGLFRDDRLILLASAGGAKRHPAWYHNLVRHPEVEVVKNGTRRLYRADVAAGDERRQLWEWLLTQWSGFAAYQKKAGHRTLPVVILTPQKRH